VFTRYARHGWVLVIPYVEAPPALRGTGAASQLMAGVMEIARTEGLRHCHIQQVKGDLGSSAVVQPVAKTLKLHEAHSPALPLLTSKNGSRDNAAVARVSAPDLEERILAELKTLDRDEGTSGRELVSRLVERITLQENRIEIRLQQAAAGADLGMTAPRGWPADVDPMGPATGRGPAGHEPAKPASDLGPDAPGSASGDRTSPALRRGAVARRRG
jgi:predicted GNAT family acetyltransferase